MPAYVCMIYGKDDTVIMVDTMNCADDETAARQAAVLSNEHVGCRGFELWSGGQKIASSLPKVGGPLKSPHTSRG